MASEFKYLFTPVKIGPVTVRNRIFSPPYETNLVEDEARGWWKRMADFHAERAKGGIGLIIMSEVTAHPCGVIYTMTTLDERHVPHLREVTQAVHAEGAKIFSLIHNPGRQAKPLWSHHANWGPSPVRGPFNFEIPHEMDHYDIKEMVEAYARTAAIVKEAGFDGIELQGSHGFLIGSFLSPASNKRTDEYGGSLKNRMRFVNEVLAAVRGSIGRDMALGISLSVDEFNPNGLVVEETKKIAIALEGCGMVDYITARVGDYGAIPVWIGDMSIAPGSGVPYAAELKQVLKIPVLAVLRIKTPTHAERILADGQADMIGMGRSTLCDPELPKKAMTGHGEDIRFCISCNQGCLARVQMGLAIECVLNPAAGKEAQYGNAKITPAAKRKKVLVVGGGPAGLKAAEIAAQRGHKVTLLERAAELGGQILLASRLPGRDEIAEATSHLTRRVRSLGVEVRLSTEATPDRIRELAPDVVVVATGSSPLPPALRGNDRIKVVNAVDVITRAAQVGQNVVVFDGGESHWKFCGTAEMVARDGKNVTLVTPRLFAGFDLPPTAVPLYYERMAEYGATIITHSVVTRVQADGVVVLDVFAHKEQLLTGVDTLVWAGDNRAAGELFQALRGVVGEIYPVGDCVAPRKIDAAIREGFLAGLKI